MAFVVGLDTYMDLDEANKIVEDEFMVDNKYRKYWDSLDDDSKMKLVKQSTRTIDKFMWLGRKDISKDNFDGQGLNWPRVISGIEMDAPYDIKIAVILQGLQDNYTSDDEIDSIKELQKAGVTRYAIESASITIGSTGVTDYGIYREIYDTYIKDYVY